MIQDIVSIVCEDNPELLAFNKQKYEVHRKEEAAIITRSRTNYNSGPVFGA